MNTYKTNHRGVTIERVSKARARQIWESGGEVSLCPAKLSPVVFEGAFRMATSKASAGEKCVRIEPDSKTNFEYHHVPRTFDDVVSSFTLWNCTSNETGNYPAFYVVK
jgi:hypothetical protein